MLNAANNAEAILQESVTASSLTLKVDDASVFPAAPFRVTVGAEIIEVGNVSGNAFEQLTRGVEGTFALSHSIGSVIQNRWTAGTYEGIKDQIAPRMKQIIENYTVEPWDMGHTLSVTANTVVKITVPRITSVPIGSHFDVELLGVGEIEIKTFLTSPETTVTPSPLRIVRRYTTVRFIKGYDNNWSTRELSPPTTHGKIPNMLTSELTAIAETKNATGVLVLKDGQTAFEWGNIIKYSRIASIRKAITALLIGIADHEGALDLNKTMEQYNITDGAGGNQTPLTTAEKQATLRMLLQSRSGVYHPAASETQGMIDDRPARGSHAPGSYFYYNNWDFNTAQAIYHEKYMDYYLGIEKLGNMLGFQDFSILFHQNESNVLSWSTNNSIYPARHIHLSTRDLAKVGQLILNRGFYNGKQVVSRKFMDEMWTPYSFHTDGSWIHGFGYSWNTGLRPDGTVDERRSASYGYRSGTNGQRLYLFPHANVVLATTSDPTISETAFTGGSDMATAVTVLA